MRDTQTFLAWIARHVPGVFYQYRLAADGTACFPFASAGVWAVYEVTPEAVRLDAQAVFDRLHPDDLADFGGAMALSARTLTPWRQQYRVVLPERGERWLEGHATPERADGGAVLWSGFIQDITERRAAEQAAREKFAAERASLAKREFLLRVSHELRTPLNAVLGFTQFMQADRALPERTQRHLEPVRKGGQHLLASSLALIEPLAIQRGIRIVPLGANNGVLAQAEPRALGQVLLNLLSNGVKYNREQGALWVELRSAGAEVAISVGDEGQGLTAMQRSKLFQPFDRLGAEDGKVAGSGLGLVISKQLIEAMRGRLEVHDRPDGGCCFEVWLPASLSSTLATDGVSAEPSSAARPVLPIALPPLVLGVEDNPVNAHLLQEVIEDIGGCRLLMADDGVSALEMARRHRPCLMVSDINLPGMNGLALVRAIRADAALRDVRCMALSGDATPESRERALQAGFDGYWIKPLAIELLEGEVRRCQLGAPVIR